LRVNWIKARHDIETDSLPFKLMQPNSEAVGPMKPLQGPTPTTGKIDPIPEKRFSYLCVDNYSVRRRKNWGWASQTE
jgi:hypothetical protein